MKSWIKHGSKVTLKLSSNAVGILMMKKFFA